MGRSITEGTEITCPLCRSETTTVKWNKREKPYFYCHEYQAAVNMNAPAAHSEQFLGEFVIEPDTTEIERHDG